MVISQTPVRISLLGGGSDYPEHFRQEGGAVLGITIDKYSYVTVKRLSGFFEHTIRVSYSKTELVDSLDKLEHPCVRECLRFMGVPSNIEVTYIADLPARTGLGSSSSFTVGLLNALAASQGRFLSKEELSRDAVYVEREVLKEGGGYQDQYFAAYGGFRHILFNGRQDVDVQHVIMNRDRIDCLERNLLLFYTGLMRVSHEMICDQAEHSAQNRSSLNAARELVSEGLRTLTGSAPLCEFGRLLHEAWQLKRSWAPSISNGPIDEMYIAARRAGAVGGKLLGAGGGGFLLLYVEPDAQPSVREALQSLQEVHFRFENRGSSIVFYESSAPRPGR